MPIKIPQELPAYKVLHGENIFVMNDKRAMTQDIRPLKIAIVNLMPLKITSAIEGTKITIKVETRIIKKELLYPKVGIL